MQEALYLRQMFGGGGSGWVQAVLVLCLFLVVLWKPERIRVPALFKMACMLLALSVVFPELLNSCMWFWNLMFPGSQGSRGAMGGILGRGSSGGPGLLFIISGLSGPVLTSLTLICGLFSITPATGRAALPMRPRHPLE